MRFAIIGLLLGFVTTPLRAAERVAVNFSELSGPLEHRASGFLHSITRSKPADDLIAPLRPRLFRTHPQAPDAGVFGLYNRMTRMGAAIQIVVSDGYSNYTSFPGDGGDYSRWELHLTNLYNRAATEHMTLQWDLWNEPDGNYFWKPPIEQFLETWRRGYQTLRKLNGRATIVGPSLSNRNSKRLNLERFLVYAKENKCLPDVLSWHQWSPNVTAAVDDVRKMMAAHGVKINRISLNEMITAKEFAHPGVLPRYFAEIHRAGVETAAHACWTESKGGVSNCENESLDGLLTSDTHRPRSVWHVYAAYGQMNGKTASVTPGATVDGVATLDKGRATILLGRFKESEEPVELSIAGIKSLIRSGKLHLRVERIADSGLDALKAPAVEVDESRAADKVPFVIALPKLGPSDACVVTLASP